MASVLPKRRSVNGRATLNQIFDEAYRGIEHVMAQRLMLWLETTLTTLLGREPHERRAHVWPWVEQNGECAKCHAHESGCFSRNGSRPRTLHYLDFTLRLRLPRVVCVCGGSVRLDFGDILRPYQRLGEDVDEQVQRWGKLGLSLRQMQSELAHLHLGPLALSTLTERLHRLKALNPARDPKDVPPILSVDAIWVTQLQPNGHYKLDRKGRRHAIKGRVKRPIFIAMGIWPDEDRCEILHWQLGPNEEVAAWTAFLGALEEQGIRGANGLQLIIHDGGSGLCSALRTVHFDAQQQRCLFHKLQNIYNASEAPEHLSPKQRRRHKQAIFKDFRDISEATTRPCCATISKSSVLTACLNPKLWLPCAETSATPSPITRLSSASLTGRANICALPAV